MRRGMHMKECCICAVFFSSALLCVTERAGTREDTFYEDGVWEENTHK